MRSDLDNHAADHATIRRTHERIGSLSMANCYFAKPRGMQHCYIPFFMLLISNALLVLARHNRRSVGCTTAPNDGLPDKPASTRLRAASSWGFESVSGLCLLAHACIGEFHSLDSDSAAFC